MLRLSDVPLVAEIAFAAVLLSAALFYKQRKKTASGLPLPPGPPAHWLFGNELPKT